MKIFVGGLSWNTTDETLRQAFESYGEVNEAIVVRDRDTGRSRGFGFVTFTNDHEGNSALSGMDGTELDGRTIRCDRATEKPRERSDRGDRGGRGGGGGGRGGDRDRY